MALTDSESHPLGLAARDRRCLWHPFTQSLTASLPIPIVRGEGVYLYAENGDRFLDGISSWWVNLHGHGHPYIAEKICSQACVLEQVIFTDFTHFPSVELASRLLKLLPGNMSKIFYSDNGSTAVESALKMALQYWHNQNPETKRTEVISLKGGYHGDTFGAMAAAGKNGFNKPFWNHLFDVVTIDPPLKGREEESEKQLRAILEKGRAACFIFEPRVLGSGGMVVYPSSGLDPLLRLCREYGVLCIADEVMTGFGRTETLFACEQLSEEPDMICLAKGLTGGFLPLGATACKEHVYQAFLSVHLHHALLHGHSYSGNPLACSSALASLDLLEKESCFVQRDLISGAHLNFCARFRTHPRLKRCESAGTILALEFRSDASSYFDTLGRRLSTFFLQRGILLRPLGNVLYVLPPYCIQLDELNEIYEAICCSLEVL